MSKSIDTLMKELIAAGYKTSDITAAAEKADETIAAEKAERERKRLEAEAAQQKINAARDRAAAAYSDYLIALGVEEALGITKEESIELAKETFAVLEEGVLETLAIVREKRAMKTRELDPEITRFLKGLGVI